MATPPQPVPNGSAGPVNPNRGLAPAEKALALEEEQKEQQDTKEKHTVLPELPNALFHMAVLNASAKFSSTDVASYWDSASFDTRQEIVRRSGLRESVGRQAIEQLITGKGGPKQFTDEEAYEIAGTPWKRLTIGIKMELIQTVYNFMGYGLEDLGDSVPELDEGSKAELKSMGIIAKLARGGWKRISMNTVQSDDNRFTITQIDPTRRSKWFLLKDMETGESYEETTMTGAKKKALEIRGDADDEEDDVNDFDLEPEEMPDTMEHDPYDDHQYCEKCGECTTCNLRDCTDGGGHQVVATKRGGFRFKSRLLRNRDGR